MSRSKKAPPEFSGPSGALPTVINHELANMIYVLIAIPIFTSIATLGYIIHAEQAYSQQLEDCRKETPECERRDG